MNKLELRKEIAKNTGVTLACVSTVLDAFEAAVVDTLKANEDVNLRGFCKFTTKVRVAYKGRNPNTGKPVDVPSKTHMRVKPSKAVTKKLN